MTVNCSKCFYQLNGPFNKINIDWSYIDSSTGVTSQHPNRGKKIPAFIIKVTKRTFAE